MPVNRSAGAATEVNLRNPLHAGKNARKRPTLRADISKSPKQGYQWPHKKELVSSKHYFLKEHKHFVGKYNLLSPIKVYVKIANFAQITKNSSTRELTLVVRLAVLQFVSTLLPSIAVCRTIHHVSSY